MKKIVALLLSLACMVTLFSLVACSDDNPNGYTPVTAEEWQAALAAESFKNVKIVSQSYNVRDGLIKPISLSMAYEIADGRIRSTRIEDGVTGESFYSEGEQYGYEFNALVNESAIRLGENAFEAFTYDGRTGLYTAEGSIEREFLTDVEGNVVTDESGYTVPVYVFNADPPAGREKNRYSYGFKDGKLAYFRYSAVPDDEKNMQYSDFCFSDYGTVSVTPDAE